MPTAEMLDRRGNWAVVQIPLRQFPAIALQGDTFHILVDKVRRGLAGCPKGESFDELTDLLSEMEDAIGWYAKVLGKHGIQLPY